MNVSSLRKVWNILAPSERKGAMALLVLMVVGMMLETLGIGMVIPAVSLLAQEDVTDRYPALRPALDALGNPDHEALIIAGVLMLVGIYFIKATFLAFLAWRQMRFAFNLQARLSQQLFTIYLHQPYTFHLQHNSAQLIRNAITEVGVFTSNAVIPGTLLLTEGMILIGIASLLFVFEPLGALTVVFVLSLAVWGFYRATHAHVLHWGRLRQYHEGLRLQQLQEGLGGVKDVKLLGREREFLMRYDVHNAQSARTMRLHATLHQIPRLWMEVLAVTGLAILVLVMLAQGRNMASVIPTLGLFAAAAFRLMPSVTRVLSSVQSLRYGLPVINTLHAELCLRPVDPVIHDPADRNILQKEIRLIDVGFTYPGAISPTLSHLLFVVRKGETVGIIGPSGSGKSTLVDIILGLLSPDNGQVLVDGRDIHLNLRSWQDQIGYVPQAIYLTDDTLRRNVAFGLPSDQIDDAAVWRAIKAAQLETFVSSLPQGLETLVGERGVRLSGGQRQRIGIARALYHDPEVLVLDEATSALDTVTERDVMRAVMALRGRKTILIVAHRLSTVEHCDRLCRIDKGTLAEEGTPHSLLASL